MSWQLPHPPVVRGLVSVFFSLSREDEVGQSDAGCAAVEMGMTTVAHRLAAASVAATTHHGARRVDGNLRASPRRHSHNKPHRTPSPRHFYTAGVVGFAGAGSAGGSASRGRGRVAPIRALLGDQEVRTCRSPPRYSTNEAESIPLWDGVNDAREIFTHRIVPEISPGRSPEDERWTTRLRRRDGARGPRRCLRSSPDVDEMSTRVVVPCETTVVVPSSAEPRRAPRLFIIIIHAPVGLARADPNHAIDVCSGLTECGHSRARQDKDLWDELELEASNLTGTDVPLWEKVQALDGAPGDAGPVASLEESLFGEPERATLQIQKVGGEGRGRRAPA